MNREFHVAKTGNDFAAGTKEAPFLTIQKAAEMAETGDKVVVHEGIYREWVKPMHSGYSELSRIVYEAAEGEHVVIKGSEVITGWEQLEGTVWKKVLPNEFFGDFNPYKEKIDGDWLIYETGTARHLGDVYLNGMSFYEADSLEEVRDPKRRDGVIAYSREHFEPILHPEQTIYQWYAAVDEANTTIYANFQGADPNQELVEINVRKCCFYPEKPGMNYITLRGFEICQAASPWTPPTADQIGMVGAHWSKGWVIENNDIHDAKCSGISIGKEGSTGHNLCTRRMQKPGYQYQMEAVFRALQIGWSKEKIGSHVIRNNVIHDCGQNGIVGHMGCVFSEIYGNHIYNIAIKHEYFGWEIAGIKLHAAIDVQIHNNRIHNSTLGIWLDWQAQGARISSNLLYNNDRDIMVEVSHGPYIVDNNIMTASYCFDNFSQGGAYINNLSCGWNRLEKVLDRATPYHFPHTTQVAGCAVVYGGDDRYYGNLFVGTAGANEVGTAVFNDHCASYEEYMEKIRKEGDRTLDRDINSYRPFLQPVYITYNAYFNGAEPYDREVNCYSNKQLDPKVNVIEEGDEVYLELTVDEDMLRIPSEIMDTEKLGTVRIVDAIFDDPQGNPIVFDKDYLGVLRKSRPTAGPIENLKPGYNKIRVW